MVIVLIDLNAVYDQVDSDGKRFRVVDGCREYEGTISFTFGTFTETDAKKVISRRREKRKQIENGGKING